MITHDKKSIDTKKGVFISLAEYEEYKKLLKTFKQVKELKKQYDLFYD